MRILITGSTGFIGRNIVDYLLADGHTDIDVVTRGKYPAAWDSLFEKRSLEAIIHANLPDDYSQLEFAFKKRSYDVVIHLAANPIVKEDAEHPTKITLDNIVGTQVLLSLIERHAPKAKLIFSSTGLIREHRNTVELHSVYEWTKYSCEQLIWLRHKQGRLQSCVALRMLGIVGPYLTHGVVHDLIKKANSPGESLEIFGREPGSQKSYLHAIDLYRAISLALNDKLPFNGVFNVCNNDVISASEIADIVLQKTKSVKAKLWNEAAVWAGDQPHCLIDNRALKAFGWELRYPTSKEAITKAVEENIKE